MGVDRCMIQIKVKYVVLVNKKMNSRELRYLFCTKVYMYQNTYRKKNKRCYNASRKGVITPLVIQMAWERLLISHYYAFLRYYAFWKAITPFIFSSLCILISKGFRNFASVFLIFILTHRLITITVLPRNTLNHFFCVLFQ